MSLYDKPPTTRVVPKIAIAYINASKFQKISLLLLSYLVLINLIAIAPTLEYIFTEETLKHPSTAVYYVTSIGLIGILAAYAIGLIRSKFPLYLVALFSAAGVAAHIFSKVVTTSNVENFSYLEVPDIFAWLGVLDGLPIWTIFYFGFKVGDLALESQRLVYIANSLTTFFICGLLIYFGRKPNA